MISRIDIEDMTDAQDEARATVKPLEWAEHRASTAFGTYSVGPRYRRTEGRDHWFIWSFSDGSEGPLMESVEAAKATAEADYRARVQAAIVARPSQAGVIRPLCWIDDTESKCTRAYAPALGGKMMVVELDPGSGEYSAGIDLSGLCFRFVLDTYHDGLGAFTAPAKFPSIEAAKSAAQADYEARVSSSLVETVGLEALVSFARPFADALDIECDFMTPPAPFEDGFDVRRRARAALAAMDTPKGGGDE